MNDLSNTPGIGDNNGPAFNPEVVSEFEAKAREFADAAGAWKEAGSIESDEQAAKANDFLSGTRKLAKEVEDRRKAEKQPFLDAGREIDAAFKKVINLLDGAANMVKPLQQDFLRRKEAEAAKARAEAERKAREEAEQAEAARRAAEARNDVAGQQEAEERAKAAEEEAAKAAKFESAKASSATGGGRTQSLRTVKTARITSINQAMLHYRDRPEMAELILRLANADARAAKDQEITIPGIEITIERKL